MIGIDDDIDPSEFIEHVFKWSVGRYMESRDPHFKWSWPFSWIVQDDATRDMVKVSLPKDIPDKLMPGKPDDCCAYPLPEARLVRSK